MATITNEYVNKVKTSLRVTTDEQSIVEDIKDLISSARADLILSGVLPSKANNENDSLISRAVKTYCKANFGLSNPDMEKYNESYIMIKKHLLLSLEYTVESEVEEEIIENVVE